MCMWQVTRARTRTPHTPHDPLRWRWCCCNCCGCSRSLCCVYTKFCLLQKPTIQLIIGTDADVVTSSTTKQCRRRMKNWYRFSNIYFASSLYHCVESTGCCGWQVVEIGRQSSAGATRASLSQDKSTFVCLLFALSSANISIVQFELKI